MKENNLNLLAKIKILVLSGDFAEPSEPQFLQYFLRSSSLNSSY